MNNNIPIIFSIIDILSVILNFCTKNSFLRMRNVNKYLYDTISNKNLNCKKIITLKDNFSGALKIDYNANIMWSIIIPRHIRGQALNTNKSLNTIKNVINLKILNSRITDDDIKSLTNLETLQISCYNSDITDLGIKNMTKLIRLTLGGESHITDHTLKLMTNLTALSIYGNNITDSGIKTLTNLKKLRFRGSTTTHESIKFLTNLTSLECEIDNHNLLDEIKSLPKLQKLTHNNLWGTICAYSEDSLLKLKNGELTLFNYRPV